MSGGFKSIGVVEDEDEEDGEEDEDEDDENGGDDADDDDDDDDDDGSSSMEAAVAAIGASFKPPPLPPPNRNLGGAGLHRMRPRTITVFPSPISSANIPPHTRGGAVPQKTSRRGEYHIVCPWVVTTGANRWLWIPPGSRSWSSMKLMVCSW
jgi:hypothetical protein